MENLRPSLLSSNYPLLKKRNLTSIDDALRGISASFLTLLEQAPSFEHKQSLKESEQAIKFHYRKIHDLIDSIDDHLLRKLEHQEDQVFALVRNEIDHMREQTREMVQKLNSTIKEKNAEDTLWQLGNQLDYFKSQTFKLFQQNKQVRKEIDVLKKRIKQYQAQVENNDQVMQKLKRKQLKAESLRKRSQEIRKQSQSKSNFQATQALFAPKRRQSIARKAAKTQNSQQKLFPQKQSIRLNQQSAVFINLDHNKSHRLPHVTPGEQTDPLAQFIDIPSDSASSKNHHHQQDLPRARIIQIDHSYIQQEEDSAHSIIRSKIIFEKIDREVQTEQVQTEYEQKSYGLLDKVEVKLHSKTSYIGTDSSKKKKAIDFIKNGFFIKGYNQNNKTVSPSMSTPSPPPPIPNDRSQNLGRVFQNNRIQMMAGKSRHQRIMTFQ